MGLLADVPNRARFNLTYTELQELPLALVERMIEQINLWRSQEDAPRK